MLTRIAGGAAPRCCVETGTYMGDSTLVLAEHFDLVHTIELSEKWFAYSKDRLKTHCNVMCHQGDSASVMERLVADIEEPAFFFLDAHFAGGDTAFGAEEVPLIRELDALASRKQKDIIVIDDLRLIGKQGVCGSEGSSIYPIMTYDWRAVTLASIENSIGRGPRSLWKFKGDRIIIFRNLSYLSAFIIHVIFVAVHWIASASGKLKGRSRRALKVRS